MEPQNNNKDYTLADYLTKNHGFTLSFFYSCGHNENSLPEIEKVGIKDPVYDKIVSSLVQFYKEHNQGSLAESRENSLLFAVPSGLVDIVLTKRKRELVISAKHIDAPY